VILLVPITPEVPKQHVPDLWPALLLLLLLGTGFMLGLERTSNDFEYVNSLKTFLVPDADGRAQLTPEAQAFLKKRPLLVIAPAKGDWDFARLIYANFLHGSVPHLVLNWVGVFAGARICTTFIPFLCTFSIFILGGSLGLLTSMWLSTEASAFIPHIGASGGIFALMGTYYVYNFRFRTRYWFWLPSRHGTINLKTSWFFFVDVILLELILSTGQFLPERVDSVDHLAHVVGFASGVVLALGLRFFQRWPSFLQTRAEFLAWEKLTQPTEEDMLQKAFRSWGELLLINPYNDQIKMHLCRLIAKHPKSFSALQLEDAFRYFSPTFVRLQTDAPAQAIAGLLSESISPPRSWLATIPYDSIIRLAQAMARSPENQVFLIELVAAYRRTHPEGGNTERKLELLMSKLASLQAANARPPLPDVRRQAP
jgi:membrane associated rhomboid family serine protease